MRFVRGGGTRDATRRLCSDLAGAKAFYSDLIGWKTEKFPGGDYEFLKAGDRGVGGIMALPDEMKRASVPQHWMGYVYVDDVDATGQPPQQLRSFLQAQSLHSPALRRHYCEGSRH